ncbi:MAG: chalcone isomerase family protein [Deltaproteobacteria bacterium]|nr:chalcone isomerase family protein [Deltaproteobacteria bacterium]
MRKMSHISYFSVFVLSLTLAICVTISGQADSAPPKTKTVAGKSLKLLGTALREFLFIDIYKLSAYSESGDCKQSSVIYNSEIKLLVLAMKKTIPKERLVSTLKETFMDNLPQGKDNSELKGKIETFLSYFSNDIKKGSYVEILYLPGRGTMLKQNGAQLGQVTKGKGFADLVWRSYFGPNTCCPGLKSDILKECKSE